MKYYCELCGEPFPYELRRIPVKFPDGSIHMLLACELCAEEYDEDNVEIPLESEE